MIRAIFAVDKHGGMGKFGDLPWPHDKEDMKWFRTNTLNQIVVMGSNTWLSNMQTPLPKRINIVISNQDKTTFVGADAVIKLNDLENEIKQWPDKSIWIIGGATLLTNAKSLINEAYITHFNESYNCDVYIDLNKWLLNSTIKQEFNSENKIFRIYNLR